MDVNSLFARAEQSFAAGRLDAARADLRQVLFGAANHPAVLHLLALVEKKRGDLPAARKAFEGALRSAPADAQINNNFANLLDALGEQELALRHYDRALSANPRLGDARYNRALLLRRMGRPLEALAELDRAAAAAPPGAKLFSARGGTLRELGRLDEAAAAYDEAIRLEPNRLVAIHGRARVAMERGEPDASDHYRRALALKPDDPELHLGLAEALEAEGKPGAIECLASLVERHPAWVDGQSALARMRWEAGDAERFTRGFETALQANPRDANLWFAYASALADADLPGLAANAAAQGRRAAGDSAPLMLLEAVHASEAGEIDRADQLYAALPDGLPGRSLHELRHRIRCRDDERALALSDAARREAPWNVSAWALTGVLWRLLNDPRSAWLHGQPGLYGTRELGLSAAEIDPIAEHLRTLHRTRAHPIGQSLRGGTQTRGRLFARPEPEVRLLHDALAAAVADHWRALPPHDPTHPLLRHREAEPHFSGSWSVRLTGGGFHISHVHPHGILSSACYLAVPDPGAGQEGWLEIGGAPERLALDLEPLLLVQPRPGRLALFPSTLFHGTRPFSAGERLTAAFDVVAG